jgi:hypothetical protein
MRDADWDLQGICEKEIQPTSTNRLYELIMNIYEQYIPFGSIWAYVCRGYGDLTFGLVTFRTFHNHPILSVGIALDAVTHGIAWKFHKTTCNHQRWDFFSKWGIQHWDSGNSGVNLGGNMMIKL